MTEQSEREAIVAWLRKQAEIGKDRAENNERFREAYTGGYVALEAAANAITAGDHLKGQTDER